MLETDSTTMIAGPVTRWTSAPTRHLRVRGESFAYRDLGIDGGTPIVLLAHLGATLDEWDPRMRPPCHCGRPARHRLLHRERPTNH